MSTGKARRRNEQGAVAVFVAILASLLMVMAALSVDLGNAWARKRAVQTQVDVSALSVGHLLPQTAANKNDIVDAVVGYLNRDNNQAYGQSDVTRDQLLDGALANGEVVFSNAGERMQVVAPGARVDFKFAGAISSGTDVQAQATVEVQSPLPPGNKVLPFAMPDQCPFGPAMADTGPGGPNGPDTSGTFSPTNSRNGHLVSITPSTATTDASSVTMNVVMNDLPNNASSAEIQFRTGATTVHSVTGTLTADPTDSDNSILSISVPSEVLEAPIAWTVWGYVKNKHTDNSLTFTVGEGSTPATGEVSCVNSASGQFGQMYSPRNNEAADQRGLALNIALGLDHNLYPWLDAPAPECGKKTQSPPADGTQDKPSEVKPNCILPQTGNDGPWMLRGLITGIDGTAGRLNANANGHTKSSCGPGDVTREGVLINNDRLSCYLRPGYTLNDLAQTSGVTEDMLDPSVVDSPRFVWIPVIHAQQRPTSTTTPSMPSSGSCPVSSPTRRG